MVRGIKFSFVAGEIVAPGTELVVNITRPLKQAVAVSLHRGGDAVSAPVSISGSDGSVKLPTKGLSPGRYIVRVRELVDDEAKETAVHLEMPVRVDTLYGKVPPEYRVEYASRVAIGKTGLACLNHGQTAPPGYRSVEYVKAVHRTTDAYKELAFDSNGTQVDGPQLTRDLYLRRYEEFGLLEEKLHHMVAAARDADKFDVAVWPRIEHDLTGYEKPRHGELTEPPAAAKPLLARAIQSRTSVVEKLKKMGAPVMQTMEQALVILATLNAAQVRALARDEAIGRIFYPESEVVLDLADSMKIARAPQAHRLGFTGRGVRVAIFERGPRVLNDLQFVDRFLDDPIADAIENSHSRLTSAIVKNVEPGVGAGAGAPHGFAPECDLYSANGPHEDALQWAVLAKACTVVSQSFHWPNEGTTGLLSSGDLFKDLLATAAPFPTIVAAAGNGGREEFVNHVGFNVLTVGNHNDDATAMAAGSVFTNPPSDHGDRELPMLCANGDGVTAVGESGGGTSVAAPAVAGTAALLQTAHPSLKWFPEACRAVLLASADRNVRGLTWARDVGIIDARDGAGALNAEYAVRVARVWGARDVGGDAAPAWAWDFGSLLPGDFSPETRRAAFSYYVRVPPVMTFPSLPRVDTVKVALAWSSKVTLDRARRTTTSRLVHNLDLLVRAEDGTRVATSSSFDNSYEVAEFRGTPGETYEIILRNASWEEPSTIAWYGIAWNVKSVSGRTFPVDGPA